MNLYYRRDGTPYPGGDDAVLLWEKDFSDYKHRRVALDRLPNGIEVSTVWLGLDHGVGLGMHRPQIFETMIFVPCSKTYMMFGRELKVEREQIGDMWRYATEEEALRGHKMQVKKWGKFKTIEQVLDAQSSK